MSLSSLPDVGFLGGVCEARVDEGLPPIDAVVRVLAFSAGEVCPGDGERQRTCYREVAEEGSHRERSAVVAFTLYL